MTPEREFVPSRLAFARRRVGMARTHLAAAIEVSAKTVQRWENGSEEPSRERRAELARVLRVLPEFFGMAEMDLLEIEAVSFRALTKMTARERDRARAAGRQGVAIMDWIEQRFTLPANDVPPLTDRDPEVAAEMLRAAWGLGPGPIRHLLATMELHGVRIMSIASDFRDVDAFSFYRRDTPFVFLDTSKTAERLRFDAAHELGHLCIHCAHAVPHGREAEAAANQFASALLMPRNDVLAVGLRNPSVAQIIRAKARWNVSATALANRLHALGLMTDWTYRAALVELSKRGFRSAEPGSALVHESSQVLGKVLAGLRGQGMTVRDIAKEFGLTPQGVTEYLFGLTMTQHEGNGSRTVADGSPRPRLTVV
ncbi:helix-turn-helix domain-containing protein [Nocardia fluminea]|uniref:helix-turn-helix domain-containing protein n=1 Tax=Nocardia fluminea TaxID=134984 RepID=UPI003D13D821